MARDWKKVRAEAVDSGRLDEERIAQHRESLADDVRAHRLADIRRAHHINQTELARAMRVSQSRVSKLERGDLAHTEVATLRAYVEALGGKLRVEADFGEERLIVS